MSTSRLICLYNPNLAVLTKPFNDCVSRHKQPTVHSTTPVAFPRVLPTQSTPPNTAQHSSRCSVTYCRYTKRRGNTATRPTCVHSHSQPVPPSARLPLPATNPSTASDDASLGSSRSRTTRCTVSNLFRVNNPCRGRRSGSHGDGDSLDSGKACWDSQDAVQKRGSGAGGWTADERRDRGLRGHEDVRQGESGAHLSSEAASNLCRVKGAGRLPML